MANPTESAKKRLNYGPTGLYRTGTDDEDNPALGICETRLVMASVLNLKPIDPIELDSVKRDPEDDLDELKAAETTENNFKDKAAVYIPQKRKYKGEFVVTLQEYSMPYRYGVILTPTSQIAFPKFTLAEMRKGQGIDANGNVEVDYIHVSRLTFRFPRVLKTATGKPIRVRDGKERGMTDDLWWQYLTRKIGKKTEGGESKYSDNIPIIEGLITKSGKIRQLTSGLKFNPDPRFKESNKFMNGMTQEMIDNRPRLASGLPVYLTHPYEADIFNIDRKRVEFFNPSIVYKHTTNEDIEDAWASIPQKIN